MKNKILVGPMNPSRRFLMQGAAALSVTSMSGFFGRVSSVLAQSAKQPEMQAVKLTPEDLSLSPPRFAGGSEPAMLHGGWNWGGPEDRIYIHSFDPKGLRFYTQVQLADTPLAPSKEVDCDQQLYMGDAPYAQVKGDPEGASSDPFTFEQRAPAGKPKALYRYSTKRTRMVETDLFDLTYHHLPYALAVRPSVMGFPWLCQHSIVEGTYRGKPVHYLGGWDRAFGDLYKGFANRPFIGISFVCVGADGTREWGFVSKTAENGIAYYCRDGREPIATGDVKLEATWVPLPYDKQSMVVTKAAFHFAGTVIHYQARSGFRMTEGKCSANNTLNKLPPGFSQGAGDIWEGASPRKLKQSYTYLECHNAAAGADLPGT